MSVDVKYRTRATATGGRDGTARSEDGKVAVTLSTPKELGGAGGDGTNPEQLFAAGYSACFIGAMKVAGMQLKHTCCAVLREVGLNDLSDLVFLLGRGKLHFSVRFRVFRCSRGFWGFWLCRALWN